MDQNSLNQNNTNVSIVQPASPTPVKLTVWQKVKGVFYYLFTEGRVFVYFFAILSAIGAVFLTIQNGMIANVIKNIKKSVLKTTKENTKLDQEEAQDNNQANALIEEAQKLPSEEKPVSDDWYLNAKK